MVLIGLAAALIGGCGSASSAVCISNDAGEVCAKNSGDGVTFSGQGLQPGSEVRLVGPDGEPFLLPVGSDGAFDPESGALGYLSLFTDTELTFAVSAIDSNGDGLEGDIMVTT